MKRSVVHSMKMVLLLPMTQKNGQVQIMGKIQNKREGKQIGSQTVIYNEVMSSVF